MTAEVGVREARPADDVLGVIREAFAGPERVEPGRDHPADEGTRVAALWQELRHSELLRQDLVAERDGRVVGHVGLSHTWVDARPRLVDAWLLSPLAVLPADQRHGIGGALVRAAIEAARAAGSPLLFLEGDPGYYRRFGFERAAARGLDRPTDRIPEQAFQVVVLGNHQDWMRGRVLYHDIWWRHDLAGLRDPVLAQLEAQTEEDRR